MDFVNDLNPSEPTFHVEVRSCTVHIENGMYLSMEYWQYLAKKRKHFGVR